MATNSLLHLFRIEIAENELTELLLTDNAFPADVLKLDGTVLFYFCPSIRLLIY
jgi:hypothetical protein